MTPRCRSGLRTRKKGKKISRNCVAAAFLFLDSPPPQARTHEGQAEMLTHARKQNVSAGNGRRKGEQDKRATPSSSGNTTRPPTSLDPRSLKTAMSCVLLLGMLLNHDCGRSQVLETMSAGICSRVSRRVSSLSILNERVSSHPTSVRSNTHRWVEIRELYFVFQLISVTNLVDGRLSLLSMLSG